ncbi:hypothetical protein [Rouxiella chamberiensis]|uniref:Uncharacterized protein n=1 Tax=Rouxiella chamberiensis TaxID=1513468 RepID=A0ABY7HRP4_9GAMM|nr:hypothetical protein [Rouxiella chamberiensis]WAT01511.1 hypothetical protein O1V66_01630 [Rouxiella chamberiensis]
MTEEQQTILMFKGLIASLPADSQANFKDAEQKIQQVLDDYPDGEGTLALGFIGAQLQAGPEMITK